MEIFFVMHKMIVLLLADDGMSNSVPAECKSSGARNKDEISDGMEAVWSYSVGEKPRTVILIPSGSGTTLTTSP